jgi:hypothetical protein
MTSSSPLVSIVTPSYNQAQFLEQTIQSVLGQGYPHIEYLVVDGASTDGSVEIIRRYADRLAWWVSEKDQGQADAINKGLRRAKGEFVAWLNSDDLYLPGSITTAVRAFHSHPEAGVVYGDVQAIDERGSITNLLRYGDWGLDGLLAFRVIGQPAVFMRRSVLEHAGYLDPSFHFLLDHQLWLRMARLSEMAYVPETLAAARFHGESKNVAHGAQMSREAYRVVEWVESQPEFAAAFSRSEKRIRAGAHRFHAHYLLDDGQAGKALRYYGWSARLHLPTALREWRRIGFAFLSLIGLGRIRPAYLRWRAGRTSRGTIMEKK